MGPLAPFPMPPLHTRCAILFMGAPSCWCLPVIRGKPLKPNEDLLPVQAVNRQENKNKEATGEKERGEV